MQTTVNTFKMALKALQPQIGLWMSLASPYSAELCAGSGFDWLLIDGEHAPNDVPSLLSALQALAPYPVHPIARVPTGHGHIGRTLIKQYLDVGVQSILVPMVDTPEQAAKLVQSMRYPPYGVRGIGGARASRWGRIPNYLKEANDQTCLLVQVESKLALSNLDAIAQTEGVDGVFIGPADLSASLGHIGELEHPEVQSAIKDAVRRILKAGKAPGILILDEEMAKNYLALGAVFVAVGVDTSLLASHTAALASRFKKISNSMPVSNSY